MVKGRTIGNGKMITAAARSIGKRKIKKTRAVPLQVTLTKITAAARNTGTRQVKKGRRVPLRVTLTAITAAARNTGARQVKKGRRVPLRVTLKTITAARNTGARQVKNEVATEGNNKFFFTFNVFLLSLVYLRFVCSKNPKRTKKITVL
jgi:predicted small secreted protein